MSNTSAQVGKRAMEVKKDLQKMGGTLRDAAQEKLAQVGDKASEYYEQGRDEVHGIACACEHFLRKKPLTSVLVVAGVGFLLGHFWNRR